MDKQRLLVLAGVVIPLNEDKKSHDKLQLQLQEKMYDALDGVRTEINSLNAKLGKIKGKVENGFTMFPDDIQNVLALAKKLKELAKTI